MSTRAIHRAEQPRDTARSAGDAARIIARRPREVKTISNTNINNYTRRLDVLPGDVNDDGVVNIQDAILVRNQWLFGAIHTLFADINGDGNVDGTDCNLVRQRLGTKLP
jgi:hypothetical protein